VGLPPRLLRLAASLIAAMSLLGVAAPVRDANPAPAGTALVDVGRHPPPPPPSG